MHYGSLANHVLGVPRLLGLAPGDAARILWLQGFKARIAGQGPEVVAQLPGWGLTSPDGVRPDPYSGSVTLTRGQTIRRPTLPAVAPGEPAGLLTGALVFSGGPALPDGAQRPPSAGVVDVFSADGKLIAQPRTHARQYFKLKVAPGVYLLNDEQETPVECRASRAVVRAGHVTRVDVGFGCDIL